MQVDAWLSQPGADEPAAPEPIAQGNLGRREPGVRSR